MQKEWTKKQNGDDLNTKLAKVSGDTFAFFQSYNAKEKMQKSHQANAQGQGKQWTKTQRETEGQLVTCVWRHAG